MADLQEQANRPSKDDLRLEEQACGPARNYSLT